MQSFDEQLARRIDEYIQSLFVREDPVLSQNLKEAADAGLPAISVSPNQGKLLYLIAKIARARRILEIGTLGGYSSVWLARALPRDGKLITLEINPEYARIACNDFSRAGLAELMDVRIGNARESLLKMIEHGEPAFDLIFIDADKPAYAEYLTLVIELSRPGSIIVADNVIRNGRVLEDNPEDPNARGVKAFNLALASHPRLESIVLPIFRNKLDGMSISIVN